MNKIYRTPENFNEVNIRHFIENVQDVFSLNGKGIANVFFDVSHTTKISIIGQLLIYKFMEYTFHKQCFFKPKTNLNTKDARYVNKELKKMGFNKLVDECFTEHSTEDDNFIFQDDGICFVSPIILERNSGVSGVGKMNEVKIANYYRYDSNIANAILSCLGEISSNFQEHAVTDTRSVIVAKGDKKHFEIACADTGNGIISSLKNYDPNTKTQYKLLELAIKRGISSKLSEGHMGCGLWLINEYVTNTKGYLCIYSEKGYLINKHGKIKCGESPLWKGTIIFVDIPLADTDIIGNVIRSVKTKKTYVNDTI